VRVMSVGLFLCAFVACKGENKDDSANTGECQPDVAGVSTACDYPSGLQTLYEESFVVGADTCEEVSECGFGEVCFQWEGLADGEATCHRSIDESQSEAPYYDFGCASFTEYLEYPTNLQIDCRCRTVGDGQGGAGGDGDALADPNNIDIDAGARPGGPIINCMPQTSMEDEVWPVQYGEGPSFNAWFQVNASGASWFSGTVDPESREMFAIIKITTPEMSKAAAVVGWDLDTGDRRVVTGYHPDLGIVGDGYLSPPPQGPFNFDDQSLTGANVIQLGSDGFLYTYGGGSGETPSDQREIVRIDPDTGERALAWLAQEGDMDEDISGTYGQCLRPDAYGKLQSVAFNGQAFAMAPNGDFYMAYRGVREGDGIAHLTADGKTCTIISAWGAGGHNPGGGATPVYWDDIGGGPTFQFPFEGLLVHDGLVYGVHNDELYSFDPTTGDRALATFTQGTYGGMGIANMFWDPTREVIWAVGNHSPYVGSIIDLTTGRRESVFADSEDYGSESILQSVYPEIRSVTSPSGALTNGNTLGNGGFVLDPDNPDIAYGVLKSGGLMKLELSTFNNYVHSW
jgi:hypothetical protein